MAGQRDDAGVREHRARVRHEQQEDEEVEGDHVEAAPQAARHRLQHDPPAHTYMIRIASDPPATTGMGDSVLSTIDALLT